MGTYVAFLKFFSSTVRSLKTSPYDSPSVCEEEVEKFSLLQDKWWSRTGPCALLHQMNPARVEYILKAAGGSVRGKKVLDIGCGGGLLSVAMRRLGAVVTGIDPCENAIRAAQQYQEVHSDLHTDLTFSRITLEEFVQQMRPVSTIDDSSEHEKVDDNVIKISIQEQFDIVLLSEVIEHAANVRNLLTLATKLVRDNDDTLHKATKQRCQTEASTADCNTGSLIITTINRTILSRVLAIFMAENVLGVIPRGTHQYEKLISPSEVSSLLESLNFYTIDLCGIIPRPHLFPEPRLDFSLFPSCTCVNYALSAVPASQRHRIKH